MVLFSYDMENILTDLYDDALKTRHISREVYKQYETRIRDYCADKLFFDIGFFLNSSNEEHYEYYRSTFVEAMLYAKLPPVLDDKEAAYKVMQLLYYLIGEYSDYNFLVITKILDALKAIW